MYKNKRAGTTKGAGILNALQAMEMIDGGSKLPAEIFNLVLYHLPVADQLRVARTCRRLQEMVYDDTRWVSRLKSMQCWDEREARWRFEQAARRRREAQRASMMRNNQFNGGTALAGPHSARTTTTMMTNTNTTTTTNSTMSTTLFDASVEEQRRKRATSELLDGFETLSVGGGGAQTAHYAAAAAAAATTGSEHAQESDSYLDVFKRVRSIRGGARQEYGRIYGALAPFYFDIVKAKTHADPIVFKAFRDPEQQAQMLANLQRFAKSDWSWGRDGREEKLANMTGLFESAVLREFEQGYEFWDVDGRMHRYAHVLHTLNGARGGIDLFIHKHPIFSDRELELNPMECLNRGSADEISLVPSKVFFEVLLAKVNEQAGIIERIFPNANAVFWEFVDKIREDIITEYTTPLFDESHARDVGLYLKAVSGVLEQLLRFLQSLKPPLTKSHGIAAEGEAKGGANGEGQEQEDDVAAKVKELALKVFEPHFDLYLQEELEFFTKAAEEVVSQWEKKLSEEDLSLETFYMANVNRSAEKSDFLSSFKKVVMMPVTALPSFPMGSPFATAKPVIPSSAAAAAATAAAATNTSATGTPLPSSRPQTPGPSGRASPLPSKAPTDELAAKAALMASKLEGIKSLCSIEVALNLVHLAKTSLDRAAVMIPLGGQVGGEAKEQCSSIFVALLRILGQRHVKSGFETAVKHLSHYNPRDVSDHSQKGVAPLVTFIELVNVGDLISQMIDVFYEQQLATPKIADRNDFLDPAALAKKKFEQMLDESVAAGLNKGIDVLMDEVEYLQSTTQLPTDYNPRPQSSTLSSISTPTTTTTTGSSHHGTSNSISDSMAGVGAGPSEPDIGPTPTAKRIVALVSSHTRMLVGTTDKAMLDVFNGEVGQRLFTAICKHLKRQRVSTDGAVKLIADMNLYADYVRTLKHKDLVAYFTALRELSQIYLIDQAHAKEMASVIADGDRFGGVFRAEEVYEYAQRRADWYQVKKSVERAMYGMDCVVM
ncbi:hypothetical protein E4U43_003781 [Claviceps pusilla]|uniref:F-box domain-containing protein n=1 Tax=Claviceps pusilla TaxID=123648 RepID=A0A9P7NH12_9HYPO|nr:hypothetical protein E4U43_003781 [Claviceps pusilla]